MKTASTPNVGTKSTSKAVVPGALGHSMAHTLAALLGVVFLAMGVIGFVAPGFMGMHLNLTHSLIHIVTGATSLFFGMYGTSSGVGLLSFTIAAIYGVLGISGILFGGIEQHTISGVTHGMDESLLKVIPGRLEVAAADHAFHLVVAALYLVAGFLSSPDFARSRRGQADINLTPPPPPL